MCQISWDMSQITMKLQDRARKIDSYTDSLTNSDIGINSLTYIQQSTENFRHAQNYSDSRLESQHLIQPARIELHTFNLLTDTGKKQISNNKGFKWRILWYIVPKFDLRREPMSVPILDPFPPYPFWDFAFAPHACAPIACHQQRPCVWESQAKPRNVYYEGSNKIVIPHYMCWRVPIKS